MSIEFFSFNVDRCSLSPRTTGRRPVRIEPGPAAHGTERRSAANRRNAQLSTGPRTARGKRIASRNALKHGLCAATAIPPCEDLPTFNLFLAELEEELQPTSILQKHLFPQIANLMWRLRRLPEAQAHLFEEELDKAAPDDGDVDGNERGDEAGDENGEGETISPSELLARRFSDDASNGFVLLGRYERSMQNTLLRLLRQYHQLKKLHPYTPYAQDETFKPRPAAPSDDEMQEQEETFARRQDELALHMPPRNQYERDIDNSIRIMADQKRTDQKRTQTNPSQNEVSALETKKCRGSSSAPVTKRTQCVT